MKWGASVTKTVADAAVERALEGTWLVKGVEVGSCFFHTGRTGFL